jgi:hypothetical protein
MSLSLRQNESVGAAIRRNALNPDGIAEQIRVVQQLTDWLGLDHDLAMMQALLEGPLHKHLARPELRRFLEIVTARRRLLQGRAFALARTAYLGDELTFVKELHRGRRRWRSSEGEGSKPAFIGRTRTNSRTDRHPT